MTKYTEAQAKAIKKYLSAQAEIKLRMRPTQKDIIVEAAKESGDSIQAFILEAVSERIDREQGCARNRRGAESALRLPLLQVH